MRGSKRSGIHVDERVLVDLRARLALTRFDDQRAPAGWQYGFDATYLKELCDYWTDEFDWRGVEQLLNRFDHEWHAVDGEELHCIHQRSDSPSAIPLLMLHGWPSSVYEFHKVIEPLVQGGTHTGFHVVCPSLPGFAWSGPTRSAGWDVRRMARAMAQLMSELGYERFAIQGTDWGALVGTELSLEHADRVIGLHLNMVLVREPAHGPPLCASDRDRLREERKWLAAEMAYDHVQSTKPDVLASALQDSPAGLAAWMVDKFRSWSDCGGDVEASFTKDELLAAVTTMWVTDTVTSSMRLYFDHHHMSPGFGFDGRTVQVPTACAMFPAELYHPPRSWVEARYNLQRWTQMSIGGHFAALEEPALLVDDVRSFFTSLGM